MKPLHNAVRESHKRLASMTPSERESLAEEARKRIYPNGHWVCDHLLMRFTVAKGSACPVCERSEHDPSN